MSSNSHQTEVVRLEEPSFLSSVLSLVGSIHLEKFGDREAARQSKEEAEAGIKRAFDIAFSASVLALGMPVYLTLMAVTKLTSKGPVFFKQERIGEHGRPFCIYKFRSMEVDAEKNGPQLASDNDPRVTKWGNFMRKTHLDELPQFWNVLKGDMSIVGPRPERAFFVDQIIKKAPMYRKLQRLKPGITSIGQVDFGYAESVEEMCERMKLDLTYLHEPTIWTDINIIAKTVRSMLHREGQ